MPRLSRTHLAGLALLVLAACGDQANTPDSSPDLFPTPDAKGEVVYCNPIWQTGCALGQKCTWIRTETTTAAQSGETGCVPTGDRTLATACDWGDTGSATGYDNCAAHLICAADTKVDNAHGTCVSLCDLGAADMCPMTDACTRVAGYFTDLVTVGLCQPN